MAKAPKAPETDEENYDETEDGSEHDSSTMVGKKAPPRVTSGTETAMPAVVKRKKRGVPALAWIAVLLVVGGIGAAVALVIMNGSGGGGEVAATSAPPATTAAAATAASTADAGTADAGAADAGAADVDEVADAAAEAEAADEVADADEAEAEGEAVDEVADGAEAADGEEASEVVDEVADGSAPEVAAVADGAAAEAAEEVAAADVAAAEVVVKLDPKESTRLNELGLALRKGGDHAGALKAYEQAVQANPDAVWARYNYACELALAGKKKEALAELTTLYKLGTADARRALAAARKDSDFASIRDMGQFFRLTNF